MFASPLINIALLLVAFTVVTCSINPSTDDQKTAAEAPVNKAPTVNAGDDQTVNENTLILLNASASDSDGSVVASAWLQDSGTVVTLNAGSAGDVTFIAPDISNSETLSFMVTATDDKGATASDTVEVTVNPVIIPRALNDTGITLCGDYAYNPGSYTHNNDVDCALTMEIASGMDPVPAGQDGHYGRDIDINNNSDIDGSVGFSFTKLNAIDGGDLAANATEWGCVRDEVTGLIWEVKETTGLRKFDHVYTWYNSTGVNDGGHPGYGDTGIGTTTNVDQPGTESCEDKARCDTEKYAEDVNNMAEALCGYTDWRVPTRGELSSIVHYGKGWPDKYLDADYFPNGRKWQWTSSPDARDNNKAWLVVDGQDYSSGKHDSFSVRLVRD